MIDQNESSKGKDMSRFQNSFRLLAVWCGIIAILSVNSACNNKKTTDTEIQPPETAIVENIMKINTAAKEIKFVSFSPDGEKIYSAAWKSMDEYDLTHANKKSVFAGSYNGIGASFFKEKKNKELLVHGRTGKTVRLPLHLSGALITTVSDDGKYALVKNDKRAEFMIFDIPSKLEISSFTLSGDYVLAVAKFSPDNNYIVLTGFASEPTILYDIAKGAVQILKEQSGNVESFAFTPNSKHFLAASYKDLKYWNLGTGEIIRKFPGEDSIVYSIDVSSDGKYALSGDRSGAVKLWDIQTGKVIKIFRGHISTVNSVAFSPNGKYALSGSDDGTARLWDIATGKEVAQFISFSDSEWVVMTTEGYFNASPHGAKYISVRIGDSVYPVDTINKNLYDKYLNPERVISILQGK